MHRLGPRGGVSIANRLSVGTWGVPKVGKTSFSLSFPRPYIGFDFNKGYEGVVEDDEVLHLTTGDKLDSLILDPSHPVILVSVQEPVFAVVTDRVKAFNDFKAWYSRALGLLKGTNGTVAIDTATELHDLVLSATLEEVHQKKYKGREDYTPTGFDYGARNDMMSRIYTAPLNIPGLNAVFTHIAKDEYVGKEKSGRKEINAWHGADGQVQVMLHQVKTKDGFAAQIELCRFNPRLEGTTIDNPSYQELMDWINE